MTHTMTTQPEVWKVMVGVDTHKPVHVAVAIDTWEIRLGDHSFVADSSGYQALLMWAHTPGRIETFGIEGTGSYGAGLARAVRRAGHRVTDVNRGDRRLRRAAGKSDTIDAEAAARSVLTGQSTEIPKTADGAVEIMRQLKVALDTAVQARPAAMITLKQIIVTASPGPDCEKRSRASPPTLSSRAAPASDRAPSTHPPPPPSTPSGHLPAAGSPSTRKSRRTTGTSCASRPRRHPRFVRASGSAQAPRPRC